MVFESSLLQRHQHPFVRQEGGTAHGCFRKIREGLDPNTAEEAVNRACQLIEELGAGEVMGGIIDLYPKRGPVSGSRLTLLRLTGF